MHKLLISYQLNSPDFDYEGLEDEIRDLGEGYLRCFDSLWIIATNLTPAEVRDRLLDFIDRDEDELLVMEVEHSWASYLDPESTEWLEEHLSADPDEAE